MSSKDLVETALRVLVAWNDGQKPASPDVNILRRAFPSSAHWPIDELACQVIRDLSGTLHRDAKPDPPAPRLIDEVA